MDPLLAGETHSELNCPNSTYNSLVILTHYACLVFKTATETVLSQVTCVTVNVILDLEATEKHSLTTVEAFIS